MRACKNLLMAKKRRQEELKDRVIRLEKELDRMYEFVREQEQRITQLELARRLGN